MIKESGDQHGAITEEGRAGFSFFFFSESHLEGWLKTCCLGMPGKGHSMGQDSGDWRTRRSVSGLEVWEENWLLKEQHYEGSGTLVGKCGHI